MGPSPRSIKRLAIHRVFLSHNIQLNTRQDSSSPGEESCGVLLARNWKIDRCSPCARTCLVMSEWYRQLCTEGVVRPHPPREKYMIELARTCQTSPCESQPTPKRCCVARAWSISRLTHPLRMGDTRGHPSLGLAVSVKIVCMLSRCRLSCNRSHIGYIHNCPGNGSSGGRMEGGGGCMVLMACLQIAYGQCRSQTCSRYDSPPGQR